MPDIKVLAAPKGPAYVPEWVQKGWVGLVFEGLRTPHVRSLRMGDANLPGWIVFGQDAFEALEEASPTAHEWWEEHFPRVKDGWISFSTDICEVVPSTS